MLRLYGRRAELAGFVARKENYAPRFLRIAFKHIESFRRMTLEIIAWDGRTGDRSAPLEHYNLKSGIQKRIKRNSEFRSQE
jgi:hypothetical protein